jgi:Tfp pilus assembly protein PilF
MVFLFSTLCLISCTAHLEAQKKQGEALKEIGKQYFLRGDYASALKNLLESERLCPNDPYLQDYLGQTYIKKNKPDLAIKHFKRALAIKPDYTSAMNNMGTAYMKKKDWDAAITCFQKITGDLLYLTPQNPLFNLGWSYYNKKEYNFSEEYYRKALLYYQDGFAKDAIYTKSLNGLALVYIETGKGLQAVETLEKAIKHSPRFVRLYFDLAKAYMLLHNYKKALYSYHKVVELAPESQLAGEAKKEAEAILNLP